MLHLARCQPVTLVGKSRNMRLFLRISLLYLMASVALMVFRFPNFVELVATAIGLAWSYMSKLPVLLKRLLPFLLLLPLLIPLRDLKAHAISALLAAAGSVAIQVGFTFLKSAIPSIVPFYADPPLASLDLFLHGGHDPWQIAHAVVRPETALFLMPAYLHIWATAAIGLPVVIALSDRDEERVRRFVILYIAVWIGLGNVIALAVSSAGPVFYDDLLGGGRFAALTAALQSSGLKDTMVGDIQAYLWTSYEAKALLFGSGISAFPSVHLGIATLTALYLFERQRFLILPGIAFVAVIQFLSVYTGYHYAIDGYFSIAAVIGLWMWLRRRQGVTGTQENYAAD